jgi:hypothetical protein
MVSKQDLIRNKLAQKVFNVFGKTTILKKETQPTYNTRGELIDNSITQETVITVPYNITLDDLQYESIGELKLGSLQAAVPYTIDISEGDIFEYEGIEWKITTIEKNYLPDNVVTIASLTKVQD